MNDYSEYFVFLCLLMVIVFSFTALTIMTGNFNVDLLRESNE